MWIQHFWALSVSVLTLAQPFDAKASRSLSSRGLVGLLGDGDDGDDGDFFTSLTVAATSKMIQDTQQPIETSLPLHALSAVMSGASNLGGKVPVTITTLNSHTPADLLLTKQAVASTTSLSRTSITSINPTYSIGYTSDAPSTPPAEATEWKVIGIAVIAVGFVGTVILAVAFFDSWWAFTREVFLGKRKGGGSEDMVPNWEQRSWEFRLASEDGHRYPTRDSMDVLVKEQTSTKRKAGLRKTSLLSLPSPKATYSLHYEPHPMEPLTRRPSTRGVPFCIVETRDPFAQTMDSKQ